MNILVHELHDLLGVVAQFLAEVGILEVAEVFDHVVDDGIGEHAFFGVDLTVFLQLFGGSHAAVGKLFQTLLHLLVLGVVDVDAQADVGLLCHLKSVRHLEAVTGSGAEGGHQQIHVGAAVGGAPFEGLLVAEVEQGLQQQANRQVYYSTNYTGGNVNDAVWIPLNVNDYATTYTTYTQALPDELLSANNLRFAFRYQDNTNSMWMVKDFKVVSIVEQ